MADSDKDPIVQQMEVVEALIRLSESMKELKDSESAPVLSHYRHNIPEAVTQSYDILHQGAQLIHGTSTKYTLLGKLDAAEQAKMTKDLLQGCQLLATACVVLHDDQTGCARSTRHHCKQAARAVVHTVLQLVQAWVMTTHQAMEEGSNLGAQKTGAVWEMCDVILERKLPKGNRSAMRRDLLTFMMECTETTREFQEMIDSGPSLREEEEEGDEDVGFDDFLRESQYSTNELPVATTSLYFVKCSRGCINLTVQAIEAVGEELTKSSPEETKSKLKWISRLHELATRVGEGMTDLGASMYPPLDIKSLEGHVERQANAIQATLDFVVDGYESGTLDFPDEVNELRTKVLGALQKRRQEMKEVLSSFADGE